MNDRNLIELAFQDGSDDCLQELAQNSQELVIEDILEVADCEDLS